MFLWLTEKQRSPFLRTKADILLGPAVSFQNCFLSFQTLQINGLFKAGWTAQPLWGIYFKAVLFFILHHDNKKDKEPAEESKQRVDSTAWQSSQVEHISDVKPKKKKNNLKTFSVLHYFILVQLYCDVDKLLNKVNA